MLKICILVKIFYTVFEGVIALFHKQKKLYMQRLHFEREFFKSLHASLLPCEHSSSVFFFPGTPVSSTNKTDHYGLTEILLKVTLNTINQTNLLLRQLNQIIF